MNNIKVNPDTSTTNIDHLYPISASLSQTLVNLNYGTDGIDKIADLRELFYIGRDNRLDPIEDSVYYDWQKTIFNEFMKGKDLYLQDSCNGYWAIVHQRTMTIETGYGRFKHYYTNGRE